jgi:trimethylamine--corrinoid protein Co-methyltransferase
MLVPHILIQTCVKPFNRLLLYSSRQGGRDVALLRERQGGLYQPLTKDQVDLIHETALRILEQTGITWESGLDETVALLEQNGAEVDRTKAIIRLPRDLVAAQAEKAPAKITLYGRSGHEDLVLSEDRVHLGTGGAAVRIVQYPDGEARPPVLNDLYQIGRLVDKLDNIDFLVRPFIPSDIPEQDCDLNVFYACLKSTGKHIMMGLDRLDHFQQIMDMAAMLAGGQESVSERPFFSIITSFIISPLKLSKRTTMIMQEAARRGIPVALSCGPMAGMTAPVTMAATVAMAHAEQLAGITIGQLTNPGAPLLYGGIPTVPDFRTFNFAGCAVETSMMNAAIHQMARKIRVPNYNSAALSDAKVPDTQAGWEKGISTALVSMSGSNYIHHAAGMLESMLAVSYEQYVIDDEIIGMCGQILKGIQVDEDRLALEVIDKVGPDGNFMVEPHTLKYMRNEYFQGNGVTDRSNRETWISQGSEQALERAHQVVEKILASEHEIYLEPEVDKKICQKYPIHLKL